MGPLAPTSLVAALTLCLLLLVVRTALSFVGAHSAFAPASSAARHRPPPPPAAAMGATAPLRASAGADVAWHKGPGPRTVAEFAGTNVLVTGASGGIGRSLALGLARCGASTLVLSGRSARKLEEVAAECRAVTASAAEDGDSGCKISVLSCDLASPEAVARLGIDALSACAGRGSGNVDVLVNNGGLSSRSPFVDTSLEVDELLMRVNFLSGAQLARSLVPGMAERDRGKIIWIGSVQGLVGIPSRTSYAASKFAVQGYCESLRAELGGSGIAVHCVSPGYVRTGLSNSAVTGSGEPYGKTDKTTANGASPDAVASEVLDRVASGRGPSDFTVAAGLSAKAAIWLRLLAPSLLERMLVKRFEKGQRNGQKED